MPAGSTAFTSTIGYLSALINRGVATGEPRIPPVVSIARGANVSTGTAWKAVRALVAEGKLVSRRGSGIRIHPDLLSATESTHESSLAQKWQRTAARISADVFSGEYRAVGKLPTIKELAGRYGVCYPTMKKVLDRLVADGIFKREAHGYGICTRGAGFANSIVLFTRVIPHQHGFTDDLNSHLQILESECRECGVRLKTVLVGYADDRLTYLNRPEPLRLSRQEIDQALGFMVWSRAIGANIYREIVEYVGRTGKPLAVWGAPEHLPAEPRSPMTAYFRGTTDFDAGRQVAKHVLAAGHKRIAYVTCHADSAWSQERLRGMRQAIAECGHAARLVVFASALSEPDLSFPELQSIRDSMVERGLDKSVPAERAVGRATRHLAAEIQAQMSRFAVIDAVGSLVQQALSKEPCTAWVADSDATAVACGSHLSQDENAPTRLPALVGFGDRPSARMYRTASFCFNEHGVIGASVLHILRAPKHTSRHGRPRLTVIPGYVRDRDSTLMDPPPRFHPQMSMRWVR